MSELGKGAVAQPGRTVGGLAEWPTLLVAGAIYAGWIAATYWHSVIPTPVLAMVGAWLIAWHGSLQHETIHGHPFRSRALNTALGFVPLSLWLPYALYRRSHVAHHRSPALTDPLLDPESRYLRHGGGIAAIAARAQGTLVGRLLLGPPIALVSLMVEEAQRARVQPRVVVRDWLPHFAAVGLVVAWLAWTKFDLVHYVLLFVYPGMALTLLRSFAEHRADLAVPGRAASVERGGVFALLYLNNNLHAAHHDRPELAWYLLPAHHHDHHARLTGAGAHTHPGYGSVARRFAFRRNDVLVHPAHDGGAR
ncbi:fatty acid desaturase [Sphingomonas sp. HMWF008]|nr:fatty acid desaturase [Sphingomonas sp. HMWF008]